MKLLTILLITFVSLTAVSCDKEFLNMKPDKALVIPSSLTDLRALLDHEVVMNISPSLGVLGGDEYYLAPDRWAALAATERNGYIWAKDIYEGTMVSDWNKAYEQVFYSNVVLETITKISKTAVNELEYDNIKGGALFFRAYAFFNLAQIFASPYQVPNASVPGIPLRLTSDINVISTRAGLEDTYKQIVSDLEEAKKLVPASVVVKTRVSKPAVYAMLARTYLVMQNYEAALAHADSALSLHNTLMNYNELSPTASRPIVRNNVEVIFNSILVSRSFLRTAVRDTSLFNSYHKDDLRKTIFFAANGNFRGSYTGGLDFFSGLASDEMYLIAAECHARNGRRQNAMTLLNTLLEKRFKTGTFVPLAAANDEQALSIVISERRKELFFRGLRWIDLRRLNKDPRFAVTLTRVINGETYTLPPNDKRYVLPIPENEIAKSGIEQNPR